MTRMETEMARTIPFNFKNLFEINKQQEYLKPNCPKLLLNFPPFYSFLAA